LDLLKLDSDGTAYWYQSIAFHHLTSEGAFIPEIGSWKCQDDGSLLVTTVGTLFTGTGTDLVMDQNSRFTQKLTVVDSNTLLPTHRIETVIPLASDPLGPGVAGGCTPMNPCAPFAYKRIKTLASDIP
jgi:hypothetical protein